MTYTLLHTLCELFAPHLDQMTRAYARALQDRQPQWYKEQSQDDLLQCTRPVFSHYLECIRQGSMAPMLGFMDEAAHFKMDRGMPIHDLVEAVFLSKAAMADIISAQRYDCARSNQLLRALDEFFIDVIGVVTDRYSTMMLSRLETEHKRTSLLLEVSRTITSAQDPDTVLERLAQAIAQTVDNGCCTIFLMDPDTGGLTPRAGWGYDSELCYRSYRGLRFCPQGDDLQGINGHSYGICTLNADSNSYAQQVPENIRTGRTNIFPITSGSTMLGVAMLSCIAPKFAFDPETSSLIEGIINGVAVAIETAAAAQQTRRQLQESESLRRVASRLLQAPENTTTDALTLICNEARELVGGTGSAVLLREGDNLIFTRGTGSPLPPLDSYAIATTTYGQIFSSGTSTIIKDTQQEMPASQVSNGSRTLIAVPLVEGTTKTGLLLACNKPTGFDQSDLRIMEMFAAQAVLALRNTRLAEQGQKLAVAGERQRLARELHDSVTQALYAANLCADAATRSLQAGKHEGALDQLEALRTMTRQAMRDMRSLIFDLHPPELESAGLVGALQARLNAVESRSGMNPTMDMEGTERRLPIFIEEELFRIAIEALNNAAKHSDCDQLRVAVAFADAQVSLTVHDNGTGFDLHTLPTGGMGLRGMRERAERIGSTLTITSARGSGTTVTVQTPIPS